MTKIHKERTRIKSAITELEADVENGKGELQALRKAISKIKQALGQTNKVFDEN